jgi:hypothetical protein
MASKTQQTDMIRVRKRTRMGKERKRIIRSKGSTPPFAIHVETTTSSDEKTAN